LFFRCEFVSVDGLQNEEENLADQTRTKKGGS